MPTKPVELEGSVKEVYSIMGKVGEGWQRVVALINLFTELYFYIISALAPSRSAATARVPPKPVNLEGSAGEVNPSVGERDRREFQCTTWQLEPTVR